MPVLGDGIAVLAGKAGERVGRCEVHDDSKPDVARAVSATLGPWFLLAHCCCFYTYAEQVTAGISLHDMIAAIAFDLGNGCMNAVVDHFEQSKKMVGLRG